jgi:putative acetyltransferase
LPVPLVIAPDDPRRDDIRSLLEAHLAFANEHSPPEDVHALDLDGLLSEEISFFSVRADGVLLGVGALKHLDAQHVEIKSMHTTRDSRGRGVGRAMLEHLLATARDRGYRRVSLETGTMEAFTPARTLYESAGFTSCEPFADYLPSPNSAFFTRATS